MTYFVHLDFARSGERKAATVAQLFDDEQLNCGMMTDSDGNIHAEGWAILEAKSFTTTTDVNGDGTPDLVIDVSRGSVPASSQLDATLRAACKKAGGSSVARVSVICGARLCVDRRASGLESPT